MSTVFPDLGTLSVLPLELRDRIYSYVLHFDTTVGVYCHRHQRLLNPGPRTGLLRVSRRVHDEAIICMYQVNEFGFWVEKDSQAGRRKNTSIMGRQGYWIYFAHHTMFQERSDEAFFEPPKDMIQHMQNVVLNIGARGGLREFDIVPVTHQSTVGPERPTFSPLLQKVEEVCEVLKGCKSIHVLRLSICSVEKRPGSIEQVLDPVRKLRGIKKTIPVVYAMQGNRWVDWNMKWSYSRYLKRIMGMPEGAEAPKYIGDEQEPDQSENNIFDIIEGRWMGGHTFSYPASHGSDDEMEDGWSEEDELLNEFFHEMFDNDFDEAYDFDDLDDMYDIDDEDIYEEDSFAGGPDEDDESMPDLIEIGDISYSDHIDR